ncbi:OB-fold domain-containing protein [Spirillospora sp. NPDC029432]|uniref:Zn-ribbon domain-containing OB-fold protein n=1 Tax=Spirillospora sp. NPDC029432 TaxID=3154599 RepID=UPI0034511C32
MSEVPMSEVPSSEVPLGGTALRGVRCRACGRTAYPAQEFGCERCGAYGPELEPVELSGHGTVLALLTVHEHPDPAVPTPATVAAVQLDEGPVLRARVDGVPAAGAAVTAVPGESVPVFRPRSGRDAR